MSDTATQTAIKEAKSSPLLYVLLLFLLGGQGSEIFTNDNVIRELEDINDKLDEMGDRIDTNQYRLDVFERDLEDLEERVTILEDKE